MNKKNETGRSIVEMLGVLAVMGILSIAGITGYNSAMNKHRASELLNEANKRAVVVAMQFSTGKETGSTAEFSGHSNFASGIFDDSAPISLNNYNQFKIFVKNVLPEVCQHLKTMVGKITPIRRVVCSVVQTGEGYFVFNQDLTATDVGQLCNPDTRLRCETNQICTTSGEVAGSCVNKKDSWECLTNADCSGKPGTFCAVSMNNSITIRGGECHPIGGSSGDVYIEGLGTVEFSNDSMNWYSAKNWCAAKGKNLIDIRGTRLGCYNNSGLINIDSSTTYEVYCCAKDTPVCGSDITKQSPVMQQLRFNFEESAWTNTDQNSNQRSLSITLSNNNGQGLGYFSFHGAIYQDRHALCE